MSSGEHQAQRKDLSFRHTLSGICQGQQWRAEALHRCQSSGSRRLKTPYILKSTLNRFITPVSMGIFPTQMAGYIPEDLVALRNLAPVFIEKIDEMGGLLRGPD